MRGYTSILILFFCYFILPPILIFFSMKAKMDTESEPIRWEELPEHHIQPMRADLASLEALGFAAEAYLSLKNQVPNTRTYLVMLTKREGREVGDPKNNRGDKAMITLIIAEAPGAPTQITHYVEFSTRFESGKSVDTMNSKMMGSFAPLPLETKQAFPKVLDLSLLYQLHQYQINQIAKIGPEDNKVIYPVSQAQEYLHTIFRKGFEEQVETGLFRPDMSSRVFKPTIFGAFKMAYGLIFPFKMLREMDRDKKAKAILDVVQPWAR
jgi:hypothetical protein